jgi:hypothetical protein
MLEFRGQEGTNEAYVYYCYYFLPIVLGKNIWATGVRTKETLMTLATASDEAFGILAIENSKERWLWELRTDLPKSEWSKNGPTPRYSTGNKGKAKKNLGWTMEGHMRYNVLLTMAERDRGQEKRMSQEEKDSATMRVKVFEELYTRKMKEWDVKDKLKLAELKGDDDSYSSDEEEARFSFPGVPV